MFYASIGVDDLSSWAHDHPTSAVDRARADRVWLVLLGFRIDADGSAATTSELVAGWGGLLVALLGWLIATALLVRRTGGPLPR